MKRLFNRTLALFLLLGVSPTLLIAIVFALPVEWQLVQYKTFIGLLLIIATISALCLTGLVTRLLKHPINVLLHAQKEIQQGNFALRLPDEGGVEVRALFRGFNQMAEGLRLATEREKELVEVRSFSTLASQVVHDLRSPLTSLRVATAHFESAFAADTKHGEFTQLLTLSMRRLQSIAEELLSERKRHEGSNVTSVHEAIAELVDEVRRRPLNGLTVVTRFHPTALRVSVKKIDLQRVIGNIVTNAIEAMNGAGQLVIATAPHDAGAHITIEDTGPGMPPEILAKVLQGGFTHGKTDGNGVGMAVVRTIVKKAGGQIQARSTVGRGTMFILQFPLSR